MDDSASVTNFIEQVRTSTVAYLQANSHRLIRSSRLLRRFTKACAAWQPGRHTRQITETVNELLVAKCLLQDALCQSLEYEAPLAVTAKTIDFLFHTTDGNRIFYDVKTVLPEDLDATRRYEKVKGRLTPGTSLILEGELSGELAHHQFASREKFLVHSLELEEKIHRVPGREDGHTYFRMIFCGDGSRWRKDQLEDFAETYLTQHNPWDHFAAMEAHFLNEKSLTLARTIHGFCYFERGPRVPEPVKFQCDVRVPPTGD